MGKGRPLDKFTPFHKKPIKWTRFLAELGIKRAAENRDVGCLAAIVKLLLQTDYIRKGDEHRASQNLRYRPRGFFDAGFSKTARKKIARRQKCKIFPPSKKGTHSLVG